MDIYVLLASAAAASAEEYISFGKDVTKIPDKDINRFLIARGIMGAGVGFAFSKFLPFDLLPSVLAQNPVPTIAASTFAFYRFLPTIFKLNFMHIEHLIATDVIAKVY